MFLLHSYDFSNWVLALDFKTVLDPVGKLDILISS